MLQAVWGIVWAAAPHPPWVTGARSTAEAEGLAMVEPEAVAGTRRMTPRVRRTCPGGFYPQGRASWTSSAVNSWADTHPLTTTTISSSSRLVTARSRDKIFVSLPHSSGKRSRKDTSRMNSPALNTSMLVVKYSFTRIWFLAVF